MSDTPTPKEVAATLAALVDTLIPGDDDFPSASLAGTHGLVFNRIRQQLGNGAFQQLISALRRYGDFVTSSPDDRVSAVSGLQLDEPELFSFLRFATYLSYYEAPPVIAALQALGHDYNDAPQPLGYKLPPFDPAIHVPANRRGSYKKTEEIARIDVSQLSDLDLPVAEA
jgi:hypothetical protein